ncbi:MAG: tRNA 2-thiouridine(34) synthase MnmA [Halobacteriovoraceae bacterium]|nr:tRNA 2-thiouridine(34) synthase MnmA [Halobacteriovoraceae bacterium]
MDFEQSKKKLEKYGIELTLEQYKHNQNKTVICGMSGGVDSYVSVLVLKLQGYNTFGLFMRNWEENDENGVCAAEEDFKDVIKVCEKIDVPYYSVDFTKEYWDKVFSNFLEEYKEGHTPNPDILCNKEIKFNVFFQKAKELGADYLATGHYCRKVVEGGRSCLVKGVDKGKDQTYFLYTMQEKVLDEVLFPVGDLPKKVVREIAADFELATSAKKDSTGICFIGERNFKEFLSNYIKSQAGEFVNLENNQKMGAHSGYCFYTIGQRKGLGIGGPGGPWFVAGKDVETNTVYVVEGEKHPALYSQTLWFNEPSWVGDEPNFPIKCKAKARYRQPDQDCTVYKEGDLYRVEFEVPQRAIALRQSVVFYDGEICLGGGVIHKTGPTLFEQKA